MKLTKDQREFLEDLRDSLKDEFFEAKFGRWDYLKGERCALHVLAVMHPKTAHMTFKELAQFLGISLDDAYRIFIYGGTLGSYRKKALTNVSRFDVAEMLQQVLDGVSITPTKPVMDYLQSLPADQENAANKHEIV